MDIVLKLRELRRLRHMSQQEAAESSGVGWKTLSSFETGARIGAMKLSQLFQLLSAYDTSPAEFFGDGVERELFTEFAELTALETQLLAGWRAVPDSAHKALLERFLLMMEGAATVRSLPRLRAVR